MIGEWIAEHRKLVAALVGGTVAIATQLVGADNELLQAAILLATAFGVYQAPNKPAPIPPA